LLNKTQIHVLYSLGLFEQNTDLIKQEHLFLGSRVLTEWEFD